MIVAEFEPDDGRRRAPRAAVALDAHLGKAARTLCKVIDVSAHGAKLQTYSALRQGSLIWLTLPITGSIAATVMWADDFAAGCRFARPLSIGVLEALIECDGQ